MQAVNENDTVAVFGSYQSARTVAENLAKTNAKKIIHFYRSARSFEQNVASLDFASPVETYAITPMQQVMHVPRCNKAIYATGFTRRSITIQGMPDNFLYNPDTGEIVSGVYGLGITFPRNYSLSMGRRECRGSNLTNILQNKKRMLLLKSMGSDSKSIGLDSIDFIGFITSGLTVPSS